MRWIYLSPHLDDVVLSCGGLIREQTLSKINVEIWTICAGDPPIGELSPFASLQHSKWGTGLDASNLRRKEDVNACQKIGARYRHFPFLDCIYRQSKDGSWLYPSEESLFNELSMEDTPIIYALQTYLATILKSDDVLVIPLTIGNHVDHQMVRIAAEELERPLYYYPDAPYLFKYPEKYNELTKDLESHLFNFSPRCLISWQDACEEYQSQLEVLFSSTDKMRSTLEKYYQGDKGLYLWKQKS